MSKVHCLARHDIICTAEYHCSHAEQGEEQEGAAHQKGCRDKACSVDQLHGEEVSAPVCYCSAAAQHARNQLRVRTQLVCLAIHLQGHPQEAGAAEGLLSSLASLASQEYNMLRPSVACSLVRRCSFLHRQA
jgi:hypothetical protein